jgi:DNA-binding transcriptional LysR family regulator
MEARRMNITVRQLMAFLSVAERSIFTRAAEWLRIAQPDLSQHIRELEGELRIRLFDRTT